MSGGGGGGSGGGGGGGSLASTPPPAGGGTAAADAGSPNSTYDPRFSPSTPLQRDKMDKISTRRESGRQIKKVNKDLPDTQVESPQVVLNALFCL